MTIADDITLLFKDLTSPETKVSFQVEPRADAGAIKANIYPANGCPFELSTGAADADSYHDFFRLQIAFEDVWAELLDSGIQTTGESLYATWAALMGTALADPTAFPVDQAGNPPKDVRGESELQEFMDF